MKHSHLLWGGTLGIMEAMAHTVFDRTSSSSDRQPGKMARRRLRPRRLLFTGRDLFALMAPLAVEQALIMGVGMVDVAMISNVSEAAVSAVSLVDMMTYFFIVLFGALSAGGAVVVSQYLGARRPHDASDAATQLIGLSLLFGLGVTVLMLAFETPLLNLLFGSVEPDVMDAAWLYLLFVVLGCHSWRSTTPQPPSSALRTARPPPCTCRRRPTS